MKHSFIHSFALLFSFDFPPATHHTTNTHSFRVSLYSFVRFSTKNTIQSSVCVSIMCRKSRSSEKSLISMIISFHFYLLLLLPFCVFFISFYFFASFFHSVVYFIIIIIIIRQAQGDVTAANCVFELEFSVE
jgi:hypothetical protein